VNPQIQLLLLIGFLAVSAVAIGACLFFFQRYMHPEPSPVEERLKRVRKQQADDIVKGAVSEKSSRYYRGPQYKNEKLGTWLEQFPIFGTYKLLFNQADMKGYPDTYLINMMLVPLILFPVVSNVIHLFPVVFMGILVPAASIAWIHFKRSKRYQKFIIQLPDALMLMTSALRAGHSFQSALAVASAELPEPIKEEFSIMVKDINLGIPVKEALGRLVTKMDNMPDLCMFSTAIVIQREAGGNLAEVLETLGHTIRERFKLKRQISALTGQARITGMIMGCAPFGVLLILTVFMYSYVKPLYETDLGHMALGVGAFLQIIGFFVMRKIIDIRL